MKHLYCIDARPGVRARQRGILNIGLIQGGVYTQVSEWRCGCGMGPRMVFLAETAFPGPVRTVYCGRCEADITACWGSYHLKRFREIPPPEQLGITEKEVRELWTPNKEKVT